MSIYAIIFIIITVLGAAAFLAKKVFNYDVITSWKLALPIMKAVKGLVGALSSIFPSATMTIIETVITAAINGTVYAEDLWKAGDLEKEERNAAAKKYIQDVLVEAGIEVTDQINTLIDGVITAACMLMPHYS